MIESNSFLGVLLHAVGGLAAASFYIPCKKVRVWSWGIGRMAGSFLISPQQCVNSKYDYIK
jgi:L-rhamnose-H+ transport protein